MSDIHFFAVLFRLLNGIRRFIRRFSALVTGGAERALTRLSQRIGSQDRAVRRRYFLVFQAILLAVILVAFVLSRDRFRLFCNILYTTPPGFAAGVTNTISQNPKIAMHSVFLGDSVTWITAGFQAIFLGWYASVLKQYEASAVKRALSMTLFSFATGSVLTAIVGFLYGNQGWLEALSGNEALLDVVEILLLVLLGVLLIVALDNALNNYKAMLLSLVFAFLLLQVTAPLLRALDALPIFNAPVSEQTADRVYEIMLLAYMIGGYLIGKALLDRIFRRKEATSENGPGEA